MKPSTSPPSISDPAHAGCCDHAPAHEEAHSHDHHFQFHEEHERAPDSLQTASAVAGFSGRMLEASFQHGLHFCLGELRQEPRRILYIGGCRQRELAKQLSFLFTASAITLLDTDEAMARQAQEDIHCRFEFVHSSIEELPFKDNTFDFTLVHNLFEFVSPDSPEAWSRAIASLARVTTGQLLLSVHQTNRLWRLFGHRLPGMAAWLKNQGVVAPAGRLKNYDLLTPLWRYARPRYQAHPYPWWLLMCDMLPVRETRTVIATP
ncbi:MAG: class I SAM-dependent methyltransferase [Candidatus Melainabacteria bacterium]|nr:class I SAM-dependent methyltransferase [Candidatus Melainabacteria bacterium]